MSTMESKNPQPVLRFQKLPGKDGTMRTNVVVRCLYCKKETFREIAWFKRTKATFCNQKCNGMWKSSQAEKEFWYNIKISQLGCWEWSKGSIRGYGMVRFKGKPHHASRIAYLRVHGEIPKGLNVCHSCDNPICINPNHLWLGTQQDNMSDMVSKGRSTKGRNFNKKQK